jgi:hypothetical protein
MGVEGLNIDCPVAVYVGAVVIARSWLEPLFAGVKDREGREGEGSISMVCAGKCQLRPTT